MLAKNYGGLEQSFCDYAEGLTNFSYRVINLIKKDSAVKERLQELDQNFVEVSNLNKYDIRTSKQIKECAYKYNVDLIMAHGNRAISLAVMANIKDIPIVAVIHSNHNLKTCLKADYIFVVNNSLKKRIAALGFDENRIFVVSNMIKVNNSLQYQEPQTTDTIKIGVISRLTKVKGVDIFIDALALLKKDNVQFSAVIAGDGEEKENIIEATKKYELTNHVKLFGWVNNKESFYRGIDIFCLPSRQETFGLTILEAMIHSLPIVATDCIGVNVVLQNNRNAIIVENSSPQKIAEAIKYLQNNKSVMSSLSYNAFNDVRKYDMKNVISIMDKIIINILDDFYKKKNFYS